MTQKNRTSFMNDPLCRIPSFYSEFSLLERPNVQRRHVRLDNKGWCGKVLCSQRGNEEGFNGSRMSYVVPAIYITLLLSKVGSMPSFLVQGVPHLYENH